MPKLSFCSSHLPQIPFGDDVLTDEDITITVEPKALLQVIGTEMDFVQSPVRSEFIFRNPNATSECGCGESFSTDTKQH